MKGSFFWGFERPDGKVGVRNHLAVISTVHCSATVAQRIADAVGATAVVHQNGCGQVGADLEQTKRMLIGMGNNPNAGAAIIVGLGCEAVFPEAVAHRIKGKPVEVLKIQASGGTTRTIQKGIHLAQKMLLGLSQEKRKAVGMENLVLGVKCGGSGPSSGIAANPALGVASDRLIRMKGTVILGTESLYGCEHLLAQKAVSKDIALDIIRCFKRIDADARRLGHSFKEANPAPGNKRAGITTMAEKAMGALAKAGKAPIVGFLKPGEPPKSKGLWLMETRGADVGQISKQAAGGCQVLAFTTDLGNPIGLPLVPVMKITGNARTYTENLEDIDIDTSPVVLGRMKVSAAGEMIFSRLRDVADGELTKAEVLGFREFAIPRIGSAL